MALSYKARRRWSLIILVFGVPLYIVACVTVLNWLDRPPFLVELGVYVGLGILWALPFRAVFRGVGRGDPGAATGGSGLEGHTRRDDGDPGSDGGRTGGDGAGGG